MPLKAISYVMTQKLLMGDEWYIFNFLCHHSETNIDGAISCNKQMRLPITHCSVEQLTPALSDKNNFALNLLYLKNLTTAQLLHNNGFHLS